MCFPWLDAVVACSTLVLCQQEAEGKLRVAGYLHAPVHFMQWDSNNPGGQSMRGRTAILCLCHNCSRLYVGVGPLFNE